MLNQEEEAKISELKDKCRELRVPPPPDILIGLRVHDKNGVLVFDDVQRGHSWTRNFYNYMFGTMSGSGGSSTASFGAGYMSGKRIASNVHGDPGAVPAQYSYQNYGWANVQVGTSLGGIVVGTGDTAFAKDQYTLAALIEHGNSSGQMYYQAMAWPSASNLPSYTSGTKTWERQHARVINNNSGGSITVKEVGVYWYGYLFATSAQTFLIERSVLDPTVTVANGGQLTVTYTISMDFSAID